jgi:hypothetical protein
VDLWWTQEAVDFPLHATQAYSAPLAELTSPNVRDAWPFDGYGITLGPSGALAVAIRSGGACAFYSGTNPGVSNCGDATAVGVAVFWQSPTPPTVWVTAAAKTYRFDAKVPGPVGPTGGGYAESEGDRAWWVSGSELLYWASLDSIPTFTTTRFELAQSTNGFAMSSNYWFASTTDGEVFAINRNSKAGSQASLAPKGALTAVEDIFYDEVFHMLYAAGVQGSTTGIFSRKIQQSDLP